MTTSMTKIEWTEATWNPIVGCSVTSPGCTNCYAMRQAHRLASNSKTPHYHGTTKAVNGKPVWTGNTALSETVLRQPLKRRKPTMYFVNSMGDLFHESVSDDWLDSVFAVMALCPQHTFQVLTKQADRMWEYLHGGQSRMHRFGNIYAEAALSGLLTGSMTVNWPLPNVWLGVSIEDQERADLRVPQLLATPAAVRFVSCEPLLGPIDFARIPKRKISPNITIAHGALTGIDGVGTKGPKLDWVIAGGESGPGARPMHPDWARSLRDQCKVADVPFFFKQWGAWLPGEFGPAPEIRFQNGDWMDWNTLPDIDCDDRWTEDWATDDFEGHAVFVKATKREAGRLLDGIEHNGMPT